MDLLIEPARCDSGGDVVDFLDLLLVFSRRRKLLAVVLLGAVLVSGCLSFLIPSTYEARASLLPPQSNQQSANLVAGQLSALTGMSTRDFGAKNTSDMYVGMMESETIANALVDRFRLREVYGKKLLGDARKQLTKRRTITSGKDGLIVITVKDREARRAAEIANGYADELQRLTQRLAITEAAQRRLFFEQQLAQAKTDLAKAETELGASQKQTGVIEIEANAKALMEEIAFVRGQLSVKEAEARSMTAYTTGANPDFRMAEGQVAALRTQLAKLEQGAGEGATGSTGKLSGAGVEYARRFREVKYQEVLFELLSKQYESARLDEAKEGSVVQLVDVALPPERASSPNRLLIVGVLTMLAVSVTCVGIAIEGGIRRAFEDPQRRYKVKQLKSFWRLRFNQVC